MEMEMGNRRICAALPSATGVRYVYKSDDYHNTKSATPLALSEQESWAVFEKYLYLDCLLPGCNGYYRIPQI